MQFWRLTKNASNKLNIRIISPLFTPKPIRFYSINRVDANHLRNDAIRAVRQQDIPTAVLLYEEALSIQLLDVQMKSKLHRELATLLYRLNRIDEAEKHLMEMQRLNVDVDEETKYKYNLLLAMIKAKQEKFDEANEIIERNTPQEQSGNYFWGVFLFEMGALYKNMNKIDEALSTFLKAIECAKDAKDENTSLLLQNTIRHIVTIYTEKNDVKNAIEYLKMLLDLVKKSEGISMQYAKILNEISNLQITNSINVEEGLSNLKKVREIFSKLNLENNPNLEDEYLNCLMNHIELYYNLNNFENGLNLCNETIKLAEKKNSVVGQAEIYSAMTQIYLAENKEEDFLKTMNKLEEKISSMEKDLQPSFKGAYHYNMGGYYFLKAEWKKAAEEMEKTLENFTQIHENDHPNVQNVRLDLIEIYYNLNNWDKMDHHLHSLQKLQQIPPDTTEFQMKLIEALKKFENPQTVLEKVIQYDKKKFEDFTMWKNKV